MGDAQGYRPPLGALFEALASTQAVSAGISAFGRGTASLYDTHPHHVALLAACGTDMIVPVEELDDPRYSLDALLIANAFVRRFTDLDNKPYVLEMLCGIRAGALLTQLLHEDSVGTVADRVADVLARPWAADVTPENHRVPLASFETAVWELIAPREHAAAVALTAGAPHVATAASDVTATLVLAALNGQGDQVPVQLAGLIASEAFTHTWQTFRGSSLFVFERLARGRTLEADDLDLLDRLLRFEEFLKLVPAAGTRGHFDLAESFVDQDPDVRAELRSMWTSTFGGDRTFDRARTVHRALCQKWDP
jgi:hypothetical protein